MDEDDEFSVPIGVTKATTKVSSIEDLSVLLATIRFWCLLEIPRTTLKFALSAKSANKTKVYSTLMQYARDLPCLATLANAVVASTEPQMDIAMGEGFTQLVQYLHNKGHALTERGTRLAAWQRHVEGLQYALQHGCDGGITCTAAVTSKNKASICVMWAWQITSRMFQNQPCRWILRLLENIHFAMPAAVVGDIAFLENARMQGFHFTSRNATLAATNGQLQCLKYLHEQDCQWGYHLVNSATVGKQFACVEYALQHGCDSSGILPRVLDILVAAGELPCLLLLSQSAHSQFTNRVEPCLLAAKHGHLDCLTFLHEHHYAWSAAVTNAAAQAGYYDCLWYAIDV